jgi:hypothetical protein
MPFRTSVQIEAGAGWQGQVSYRVCDRAGRLVRELESGSRAWDGRDQGGKSVRAGVYFLVATDGSATTRTKLVRVE